MKRKSRIVVVSVALVAAGCLSRGLMSGAWEEEPQPPGAGETGESGGAHATDGTKARTLATRFAVEPKPLSDTVECGLDWLLSQQQEDGGWSQGEESRHFQRAAREPHERSNVADTSMAALTLVRAGTTPAAGPHREALGAAVAYVLGQIERADDESMSITDVNGTRLQSKIGQHVDTFLAAQLLSELAGHMGDDAADARLSAALEKIQAKMARHQDGQGTWKDTGWATTLSASIASKSQFRSFSNSAAPVDASAQRANYDFAVATSEQALRGLGYARAAGVELYGNAATFGSLNDQVLANRVRLPELNARLEEADGKERDELEEEIAGIEEGEALRERFKQRTVGQLDDASFISGFGSNGGEEFLSYMNISESLVADADEEWERWDAAVTDNLNRIQNEDGSWTGHHCITGRTFCTSAALLVLMADRTPLPAEVLTK